MQLVRAHGLGNDYLVLEDGPKLTPALVRALCDRHTGVGADGVLEPVDAQAADYGVRIWNPDGSIAEKSGNGLRILARWLVDERGAPQQFSVWTGHDVVRCKVGQQQIEIAMGRASFAPDRVGLASAAEVIEQTWQVGSTSLTLTAVSVGNPHCVVFVQQDFEQLPWRQWGAMLEAHPEFTGRSNVQFARVLGPHKVQIRIWERGAGETSASGSSSCAVVAAGLKTGRLQAGEVEVAMEGGTLYVCIAEDFDVLLKGPVEVVGRITVDERWLAQRGEQR